MAAFETGVVLARQDLAAWAEKVHNVHILGQRRDAT